MKELREQGQGIIIQPRTLEDIFWIFESPRQNGLNIFPPRRPSWVGQVATWKYLISRIPLSTCCTKNLTFFGALMQEAEALISDTHTNGGRLWFSRQFYGTKMKLFSYEAHEKKCVQKFENFLFPLLFHLFSSFFFSSFKKNGQISQD